MTTHLTRIMRQWAIGGLLGLSLPVTAQYNTGPLQATLDQLAQIKNDITWLACSPGIHQQIERLLQRAQRYEQDSEMNLPLLIQETQALHQETQKYRALECPMLLNAP